MKWYHILMGLSYAFSLLWSAYRHGQPKKGKDSFWLTLIGCALGVYVLYCGGFWSC